MAKSNTTPPALTPEQWEARDYRQPAGELDGWAKSQRPTAGDDRTEYVAKLGLSENGSVIVLNRAHDRVLVPPPARAALAAFALAEQPFGFTLEDVRALLEAARRTEDQHAASSLQDLAERIGVLLPPVGVRPTGQRG